MAISYNAGTNLITLDDDPGVAGHDWDHAFDMDDVLAACGAVVTKQGANAYDVSARMQFNDGVYFVSENEFVEVKPNPINPQWTWRTLAGSHVRIGEWDAASGFAYKGSFWKIYVNSTTQAGGNYYRGETLIYGSIMWNDASGYTDSISFEPYGTTKAYASVFAGKAYMRTTDIDFQDVKWINEAGTDFALMVASGYDHVWKGITTINGSGSGGIFMSGTTTSAVDLYDVTFIGCDRDVNLSGGCNWLLRLINSPTFSTINTPGSGKPGVQICFTYNVLVTANNVPLVGAVVTLKDCDGTTVFGATTGGDGKLPVDEIVRKYWYRHPNDGGNKDYNDHTLTVEKAGYTTYETPITIDHEIKDDQIALDALTYTLDEIMEGVNDIKGTGFVKDTHSLTDIEDRTTNLPNDPADQSQVEAAISTRAPAGEYDTELTAIQERTDRLPDDPADQSQVEAAISTRAPAGEYDTEMGYIPADLGDVPTDSELDAKHGAGSWETGGGGSDWGATEREQIRDALGIDGAKTKSVGGVTQKLKKLLEAILAMVS